MNWKICLFGIPFLISTAFADVSVRLEPVVGSLSRPVFVGHAGDQTGRLFVVEQGGTIRILAQGQLLPQPFLDISAKVDFGGEKGLLGLAFHPSYAANGRFFVNYTYLSGGDLKTAVAEYARSASNAHLANPGSEKILLEFDQPAGNHNAGMLAFGNDGYLYISAGDGGFGGDPQGNGQNRSTLLGNILRIDVDHGDPYAIPSDNPFVGEPGVRGEIWAYGLRNPWRFSFDSVTGRLFVGDVGQASWEEIDLVVKGGNYGWNVMEGMHCFSPSTGCNQTGLELPITELDRAESRSITGGYVYRGRRGPELWGSYIFGDFSTGTIWALTEEPGGDWRRQEVLRTSLSISSFGEDENGELYLLDYFGTLYQLKFGWRQYFAQAGDGQTDAGGLSSGVVLINNGSSSVSGSVVFFSQDGLPCVLNIGDTTADFFPFELDPRSSIVLQTDGTSDPLYVGWAEAVTDGPISGSVLYTLRDSGKEILTEAGVSASSPGKSFALAAGRSSEEGTETALAIANPASSSNVSVNIQIKALDGTLAGTNQIDLGPQNHSAVFISEIVDLPAEFKGTVLLDGTGDFIATTLRTLDGVQSASVAVGE